MSRIALASPLMLSGRLSSPAVARVMAVLTAEGGDARFVGGCVRDLLLGVDAGDIDVATPLTPPEVIRRLEAAGIRALPTGLAHGTVTALPVAGEPVEITTLRQDVETFGRQARVAFTRDWRADAARRDFTINALSLGLDGVLQDYFGGVADLEAGRVRFIGDAATRIDEDALRLLRYFRFLARFARGEPDTATLAVCADRAPALAGLSGERVRDEVLKILAGPRPAWVWRLMVDHAILAAVLPAAINVDRLAALVGLQAAHPVPPGAGLDDSVGMRAALVRLAALLPAGDAATAVVVSQVLRLSNAQGDRLALLVRAADGLDPRLPTTVRRQALHTLGVDVYRDALLLWAAGAGMGPGDPALGEALALAAAWVPPVFPLRGADVLAAGLSPGPEVGRLMSELAAWWRAADFRPDRAACLDELARRLTG